MKDYASDIKDAMVTDRTNWQRRQNQNNNFSAVVPYDMELQRKESKEFLDDLTTRDQRMMFAVLTMVLTADTKKQLDADTETILSVARKNMCQMAVLKFQQLDGLNTVLPIGVRKINTFRTLTTESLAVFMPFRVQEIQDRGGIYFGENAISHNLILCNKANLLNQSAFLLGVPGSGKSFSAKELIAFLILNTEDDILIADPEGEYAPLVEAMGDIGTVIRVALCIWWMATVKTIPSWSSLNLLCLWWSGSTRRAWAHNRNPSSTAAWPQYTGRRSNPVRSQP